MKNNFEDNLLPLQDALISGRTIKSISCYSGLKNIDDRSKDFTIENVICEDYNKAIQSNYDGSKSYDLVQTNKRDFYMNWVLKFEL